MIEDGWRSRNHWEHNEGECGPDPTCLGNCNGGRAGWTQDSETGYSVCGYCRRPSPFNLVYCPTCELVWLPPKAEMLLQVKTSDRELYHSECEPIE